MKATFIVDIYQKYGSTGHFDKFKLTKKMQSNKKRSSRTTAEQYTTMLDFFVANKGLAEGKFAAMHGRQEAADKWEELASQLNGVGGAEKSAAQWQVAWRDLKSRTSVKARERRKEMAKTGGKPLSIPELTELDLRVLGILGMEYVEGSSNCADSIPEEEHLQIALESGDVDVLLGSPTVPNTIVYDDVEFVEEVVDSVRTPERKSSAGPKNVRQRKKRTVLDSARDQFAAIDKQQADAITMQAEAAKQHAEAAMVQALAIDRLASALEQLAIAIKPNDQPAG